MKTFIIIVCNCSFMIDRTILQLSSSDFIWLEFYPTHECGQPCVTVRDWNNLNSHQSLMIRPTDDVDQQPIILPTIKFMFCQFIRLSYRVCWCRSSTIDDTLQSLMQSELNPQLRHLNSWVLVCWNDQYLSCASRYHYKTTIADIAIYTCHCTTTVHTTVLSASLYCYLLQTVTVCLVVLFHHQRDTVC